MFFFYYFEYLHNKWHFFNPKHKSGDMTLLYDAVCVLFFLGLHVIDLSSHSKISQSVMYM